MLCIITTSLLNNILYILISIHNPDYTYKYTTLSECYAIQYLQQCIINWNTFLWYLLYPAHFSIAVNSYNQFANAIMCTPCTVQHNFIISASI